jgi:hypothetical protein
MPFSILLCQAKAKEKFNVAPVAGWPGLRWGMTRKEVLKVFKGQAELVPRDQIQALIDMSPDLIRIDKLVVDGISYRVRFAFDTIYTHDFNRRTTLNGLCGFQLVTESQRSDVRSLVATVIRPALEKRFGPPTVEEKTDEFYRYYSAGWRLSSTSISLEFDMPQTRTEHTVTLFISYGATRVLQER